MNPSDNLSRRYLNSDIVNTIFKDHQRIKINRNKFEDVHIAAVNHEN